MISSEVLHDYETIQLKTFIEVIKTNNFKLLIVKGVSTDEKLSACWEEILKRNEKETGQSNLSTYVELLQEYLILTNEHQLIKACLLLLMIKPDHEEAIETLQGLGYNIQPGDFKSLLNCMSNSNNLITHIEMKQKEINLLNEEGSDKHTTFEDLLADAGFLLKFPLNEDIKLAQFNAYQKVLKNRLKNKGNERSEDREE